MQFQMLSKAHSHNQPQKEKAINLSINGMNEQMIGKGSG